MLKRLFGRGTPGKVKKSPLSTIDLVKNEPEAPSAEALRKRVNEYIQRSQADAPPEMQEFVRRQMFFDLTYRCGAGGRCMLGAGYCSFPRCFTMRPAIKGGEILAEKSQMEDVLASSVNELPPSLVDLVKRSRADEDCGKIARDLTAEIEKMVGAEGDITDNETIGRVILLAVWRGILLVNNRADAEAVDSLLQMAKRMPKEHKAPLLGAAAGWAALYDMEVRFYADHLRTFPELAEELPDPKIGERDECGLLKKVLGPDGAGDEPYFIENCAHEVFSKEVSCVIARAQNAQEHDDHVEDPMGTPCVADSIRIYQHVIGGEFWRVFLGLAMRPAIQPDPPGSTPPGQTPRHILDALGRSMLLHHIAGSLADGGGSKEAKAQSRATGDAAFVEDAGTPPEQASDSERMAMQQSVLSRMQQLVAIVKDASAAANLDDAAEKAKKEREMKEGKGQKRRGPSIDNTN